MATLDWTPSVRAAASGLEQRVFFNLDPGTSALEPIYVEFMYHTNNVRQFDYNSGPRPIQWSGLVTNDHYQGVQPSSDFAIKQTNEAFPMIDHTKTRLLGSDGGNSNILPQGTASIRLSYNNGRYRSYPLEVIDGDIVSVPKNGVIAWEARNRWWLSGRDYSLGMKNGTVVPIEAPRSTAPQFSTVEGYYNPGSYGGFGVSSGSYGETHGISAIPSYAPSTVDTSHHHGSNPCKHYVPTPRIQSNCSVSTYTIPPRCNPGTPGQVIHVKKSGAYNADGGLFKPEIPKKVRGPPDSYYIPGIPCDAGCTTHMYAAITQRGGTSRNRL